MTRESLDRALNIVDTLLKALIDHGFSVEIENQRGAIVLKSIATGASLQLLLTEHMRIDGKLKTWNDRRGFVFVEPNNGQQDIFAYIKALGVGYSNHMLGSPQ